MANINENYLNLQGSYLFANIAKKVADYQAAHPDADIIRLGIGDVTLPLVPAIVDAMTKAVQEMGKAETFRGYGPEQGYDFLRKAIIEGDYKHMASKLVWTKYSFLTAQNPTLVISKNYSAKIILSLSPTLYTLYTLIPTLWAVVQVKLLMVYSKRLYIFLHLQKIISLQNFLLNV